MMLFSFRSAALNAAASKLVTGLSLDTTSPDSIKSVSATIVYDLMHHYYNNNESTAYSQDVGTFGKPYYWWESATAWGALIDYFAYTGDASYNPTVTQALQAQAVGDFMPPSQSQSEGNNEQAFWALACMDALEFGFPNPGTGQPGWLELAKAVWSDQVARWDNATCSGGLRWQIYNFNTGYDYKNSESNGAFFLLSARLARYTGNQTYANWASTTYSWMNDTGLISGGHVYDGTSANDDCQQVDALQWTDNAGLLLFGSSIMYNISGSSMWQDRITTLLTTTRSVFFSNTSIMIESACEAADPPNCNTDHLVFKSILARYLAKSTIIAPFIKTQVTSLMTATAKAAAMYCNAGSNGQQCTSPFYDAYRVGLTNNTGLGQSLSAVSVIQSLLLLDGSTAVSRTALLKQGDAPSTTSSENTTTTGSATSTASSTAPVQSGPGVKLVMTGLGSLGIAACIAVML